jgi:hypothetical protein
MADEVPFSQPPQYEPSRGPWVGLAIGAVIILGIIAYLIYSSRSAPTRFAPPITIAQSAPEDPYAKNLTITGPQMAEAANMLGGKMTSLEAHIANHGDKTVIGATVEVTFRNSLNQVVQRESQPLMIITAREPALDITAVNNSPIKPGDTKDLQLNFEHISADWNRQYPELRVTNVVTR